MQTIFQLQKIARRINRRLLLNRKLLATAKDGVAENLYLNRLRRAEAAARRMSAVLAARIPEVPHRCAIPKKKQRIIGLIQEVQRLAA